MLCKTGAVNCMVINENAARKIISIAGGKGGVGKTLISANLALELATHGKDTVVIDLDLGGSNLHTFLGMKNTRTGIGNFLSGMRGSLKDIVHETPYENLRYIPGDVLVPDVADLQFSQKKKLIDNILKLKADYIILDLGPGSNNNVVDFFLISNSGFMVTSGQASSILNAYGFLKNVVFRFIQRAFSSHREITKYLRSVVKERKPGNSVTFEEIVKKVQKIDKRAGTKTETYLSVLKPKIIFNMAKNPDELGMALKLKDLISSSLGIDVECMGLVYFDETVERSIKERVPLAKFDEHSIASRDIERIALKIIQSEKFPIMPLDLDYYKDSFELAQIEAQNDYQEIEASRKSDEELNVGELLTVISVQQKQINELRSHIRMLTMKNI